MALVVLLLVAVIQQLEMGRRLLPQQPYGSHGRWRGDGTIDSRGDDDERAEEMVAEAHEGFRAAVALLRRSTVALL